MAPDSSLLTVGVPKETSGHERRVALVPADVRSLKKAGFEVLVEANAGLRAGFLDAQYLQQGARIALDRAELAAAEVIVHVRAAGADPQEPFAVGETLRENQNPDRALRSAFRSSADRRAGRAAGHDVCPGVAATHHAGPVDGCALVDGDGRRLQSGAAGCRRLASHVPHDDDGRRAR